MNRRLIGKPREVLATTAVTQLKYYRQRCGITAFLRSGNHLIVPAGIVGAIVAPAAVAADLVWQLPFGIPAIVNRHVGRRTTWTLLTAPIPGHLRRSARTNDVLRRCGARMVCEGDEIRLPAPGDPAHRWHGAAPTDRYRPSPVSLITALSTR
ncbi:hypothetical protein [Nocardia asteroides]|uniref:hypothetical protein n=1 Tax=Nocardia asteroides TaxID=1824 RepID=UPI003428AE1E